MKAIYKLTNLEDGKVYVGQTNNLDIRKNRHFYDLKKNKHHNKFLQNSYNKYGEENFIFECVEITDNLDERELYWINEYGGINSELNYNLKDPLTSDFSDYLKVEIKKSMSGENNPNYGNKWSEEQKEKLSKERKGLTLEVRVGKEKSDLAKEKMSKTRTGGKHTEEHKNKIREANLGEKNPNYGKGYKQVGEKNPMWGKPSKNRTPIQQFTIEGEFVKEYDYIAQVKEDGFTPSNVMYCAKGMKNYKTSGGFIWRFKE